jgi:hypothetical protein
MALVVVSVVGITAPGDIEADTIDWKIHAGREDARLSVAGRDQVEPDKIGDIDALRVAIPLVELSFSREPDAARVAVLGVITSDVGGVINGLPISAEIGKHGT